MLLARSELVAEVRWYVTALVATARTVDGAVVYGRVLRQLDFIYDGAAPPHKFAGIGLGREALFTVAHSAIEHFPDIGGDRLRAELLLDLLDVARGEEQF